MNGKNMHGQQKKSMRICVLIDAWEPIWGGGQTHVWEISTRLVRDYNCEIDIYTRALQNETGEKYVRNEVFLNGRLRIFRVGPVTPFFTLWGRLGWFLTVIKVVFRQHSRNSYTLIHAHSYTAAVPAKLLRWWLKIPVVFTVHAANHLDKNKWNMTSFIERILLTQIKFDQLISVSRHFLKYSNVNKEIIVIPNGVDTAIFDEIESKSHPGVRILWVGRFDPVKGLDILFRALKQIVTTDVFIELVLVGSGHFEAHYKNLAKQLGIYSYIKWKGKLTGTSLVEEYKNSDIFVLPSLSEGFPVTILEAWAAKLPVIVTDVGDNALLIKNGINGYIVRPGNTQELAEVMDRARINPQLKKMGQQGYSMVKKKYSWEKNVQTTWEIYKNLSHIKFA